MPSVPLLVVDDDRTFRELIAGELAARGYRTSTAEDARSAIALAHREDFSLALVDLRLPDGSGLDVLRRIRELQPEVEVVVLTGHGSIDTAIEAMRLGAFDYLRKPCPIEELEVSLQKALERRTLVRQNSILRDGYAPPDLGSEFVGASAAFRGVCDLVGRVAPTDSSVLILGETGVGKDVVAKLIHARSPRREQPLVVVECAALHEELLDSELFGHEKGAYTGAVQAKHGLFEVADGGTIFLDEIGDVSQTTQVKLLRILETGRFRHVGGTRELSVDVRVLAATNRDLDDMMKRGYFRRDLFFRMNTIRIEVPPLRDRPEDLPVLTDHFLRRLNSRFGCAKRFTPAALERLARYAWPGNARELLHLVERAVILSPDDEIGVDHLPAEVQRCGPGPALTTSAELPTLQELERCHIERVLGVVTGNRARAAQILGISERTLYRKVKEYGLGEG